jgi:beta-mannosidase
MKKIKLLFYICLLSILAFYAESHAQSAAKLWQPYWVNPRSESNQHIDLSGAWELSYMDVPVSDVSDLKNRKDPFETQVPNSVHWSYFKAGKLPHPYAHKNSTQYRWIEEKAWYYRKEVMIPASAKGNNVMLCFDGIDYFSKVWVNDSLIGVHEGMFGGPVIDISRVAKYGESNQITVEVKAGNWGNRATDVESLPRTSVGEYDYSKVKGFNPRASGKIIKPWNISGGSGTEAFFTVGMWRGAHIEILPEYQLERPYLVTKEVGDNKARIHLSMEILSGITSLNKKLHPWNNTTIHQPNEKGDAFIKTSDKLDVKCEFLFKGKSVFSQTYTPDVYQGTNWLEEDLVVPNPRLWYPNGMGGPDIYQVCISLSKNGKPIDRLKLDYGIRTIERLATPGPRTADRWENWQFVVNGKKIFVKGMNWMPADLLLDLPESRYRWALEAARNMGIQLMRIWGGGLIETDEFYKVCNELGIMVWQDFPIGNQDTPDYPQDVWEAQVVQNIFRLRNHPSLAVWCGGNEFNPYSLGSTASIGIIERNLDIFDKSRFFVRTTPDDGSMHTYPDMDPCWYNVNYKFEPWVSETGMHSMPEAKLFYELVDNKEFVDLGRMWDQNFYKNHPEFIHHFTEYGPSRVPRMLSRASHIDNMANPSIESITEATQVGSGEFYQLFSEKMQANYPVTTGLMPWVYKRPWPVIAIQTMDWFGQTSAPYYFLKRTYEPTHISLDLARLIWKPGESVDLMAKVTNSGKVMPESRISVSVFDDQFVRLFQEEKTATISEGTSVTQVKFGSYSIPESYKDRFLFLIAELHNAQGELVSRSVYYPRVLTLMDDPAFYARYTSGPVPWITLDKGPWLKPTVAQKQTKIQAEIIDIQNISEDRSRLKIEVSNIGKAPAFMVNLNIDGIKRAFFATDNYFWLAPGESREIEMNLLWRDERAGKNIVLNIGAWNSKMESIKLK